MSKAAWPYFLLISFAAILSWLSVSRYLSLSSSYFDLGIFESLLVNGGHGDIGRLFQSHAHVAAIPYLLIISAVSANLLAPVLVSMQALTLAFPLVTLWRRHGTFILFSVVCYAPIWFNGLFDFHFDHLAVPLLLWFYLAVATHRLYIAMLPALLLMLVKEPFALQTVACGLFILWMGRGSPSDTKHRGPSPFIISGLVLITAGTLYFHFATSDLIAYFSNGVRGALDTSAFSWMGHTSGEMISYLASHPLSVLAEIASTPAKWVYLIVIFGLLAFIPLLAPSYLIPTLPLLAIAMLSRLPNYYDYNTHYTAGLIVPVMFAFIHGLPKAHRLWMKGAKWAWARIPPGSSPTLLQPIAVSNLSKTFYLLIALWILLGHVLVSPSPFSRLFWSDKVWTYNWKAYFPDEREAMMKEAMLKYIPADPNVAVTTQNTVNWYHLAHRKVYAPFPAGIAEPIKVMDWSSRTWDGFWEFVSTGEMSPPVTHDRYADYVVLDVKRPWFLVDKGCEWVYGRCQNQEAAEKFLAWVERTRSLYNVVFERDGFMILRRKT